MSIDRQKSFGRRRQRGVVMYVAIIVLLVMTLAGLALLRQMSATSAIAGNVAFKQGATSSADWGIESAHAWLTNPDITTAPNLLADQTPSTDQRLAGAYFASSTSNNLDPTSSAWATLWAAAPFYKDPATNDQIRFVIERLCQTAGAVQAPNVCIATRGVALGHGGDNITDAPPPVQPYYRITAQVIGARNTVSYTQVVLGQ